jgi:hypothetical protein
VLFQTPDPLHRGQAFFVLVGNLESAPEAHRSDRTVDGHPISSDQMMFLKRDLFGPDHERDQQSEQDNIADRKFRRSYRRRLSTRQRL